MVSVSAGCFEGVVVDLPGITSIHLVKEEHPETIVAVEDGGGAFSVFIGFSLLIAVGSVTILYVIHVKSIVVNGT